MSRLNIAIIGTGMYVCGRGTAQHGTVLPAVAQWSRAHALGQVVLAGASAGGVAAAQAKARELQQRMGLSLSLQWSDQYRQALRAVPKPACAIVVVPDHLHRDVAGAAIEAGLHTLVVKPLAPTLREAQELVELAQQHRVYGAVEFHKRYDRANLLLRDRLNDGTIGDPLYAVVEYSQRKSVPAERFAAWVERTDSFQYLGVHYVDILAWATRARPVRVMACGQTGWLAARGLEAFDAVQAVIEWELPSGNPFVSHLLTSWVDPESTTAMSNQTITVVGTQGRITSDQTRRGMTIVSDARGVEEPNPDFCAAYGPEGQASYQGYGIQSIGQFLDDAAMLHAGTLQPEQLEGLRPTFAEAVVSSAVVEAAGQSLRNGQAWIAIPELAVSKQR